MGWQTALGLFILGGATSCGGNTEGIGQRGDEASGDNPSSGAQRVTLTAGSGAEIADSIAFVGDLDGDGLGDLVFADRQLTDPAIPRTPGQDPPSAAGGRGGVYVMYGRPHYAADERVDGTRLLLDHSGGGSYVGVSAAGDFNGDGLDDLLITVARPCTGTPLTASAHVVFGSAERLPQKSLVGERSLSLEAPGSCGQETHSGAGVGDLDGDGFDDVVLTDAAGRARLVYGGTSLKAGDTLGLGELPTLEYADSAADELYLRPAPRGDYDGDGYDDLVLGLPGGVLLTRGGPERFTGLTQLSQSHLLLSDPRIFAFQPRLLGDLNGDGQSELAVDAQTHDHLEVFLLQGNSVAPRALEDAYASLRVDVGYASFDVAGGVGGAVGGVPALAVGHAEYGAHGAAFLVDISQLEGQQRLDEVGLSFPGHAPHAESGAVDFAGSSLALGDVDGDGAADLVVGAPDNWVGGEGRRSRAYLIRSSELLGSLRR